MTTHSNATNPPLTKDIRRRARRIINNPTYSYANREFLRYALTLNDPRTPEMVHRAESGRDVVDNLDSTTTRGG